MEYIVDIEDDENDEFERQSDNVITVNVTDLNGNDIEDVTVNLFMSKNAMLGFGTELIRLAYAFHEGKHVHLEPAELETLCQRLGVFLSPESKELMVSCSQHDAIDEYLKK